MAKGKSSNVKGRRTSPPMPVRRQRPWGLIAGTVAIVVFAVAVIGVAVARVRANSPVSPTSGVADAAKIPDIVTKSYQGGQHVAAGVPVGYDESPPIGGPHDGTAWADCTGTVYDTPIRNENAVHSLEHGAAWVTYRPGLSSGDVSKLAGLVDGKPYRMMSPYPGLRTPVSLQAWNHQVFLTSVDMKTVRRFLRDLAGNTANAPEPNGSCTNPDFKLSPQPPGPSPRPSATPSRSAATGKPTPSATRP
jgi:hypothetical protein